jgi:hypothetical protein
MNRAISLLLSIALFALLMSTSHPAQTRNHAAAPASHESLPRAQAFRSNALLTPVCSITTAAVGSLFGASAQYVTISNGLAYVNVGGSLHVIDVHLPPSLEHLTNLGTDAFVAAVDNNLAYIEEIPCYLTSLIVHFTSHIESCY